MIARERLTLLERLRFKINSTGWQPRGWKLAFAVTLARTERPRPQIVDPRAHPAPAMILLSGVWFAVLTGVVDIGLLAVRESLDIRHALDHLNILSLQLLWMAALANLVIFALPAICLFLLAYRWPGLSFRTAIGIFSFLSFVTLLSQYRGLHPLAVLVLGAGVALQISRFIQAHLDSYLRVVQSTFGWTRLLAEWRKRPSPNATAARTEWTVSRREFLTSTGAVALTVTVGIKGWEARPDQLPVAKRPALPSGAPNVLMVVLDTVRSRSLGVQGYSRATSPNLEQLVGSGVFFDLAIASAPWTLPSHASMFTGRLPNELSVDYVKPLDATYPTLAEALNGQGYDTAGFVANLIYCNRRFGLDRGFAHYDDFSFSPGQIAMSSSLGERIVDADAVRGLAGFNDLLDRKDAATVNAEFLAWQAQRGGDRPFFAFLNYFDAHEPYMPRPPFQLDPDLNRHRGPFWYGPLDIVHADTWKMSTEEVAVELDAYEACISYIDYQLGSLFSELERKRVLDNTLVIVVADHGEEFGEHAVFDHGGSLYLPSIHVPLLISMPGRVPQGLRVKSAASLRDIPATVVDLIGLARETPFPGASLARYWGAGADATELGAAVSQVNPKFAEPAWYPIMKGSMRSLVRDHYHYIQNGDGSEELYDIANDPGELQDLAPIQTDRQLLDRFRIDLLKQVDPT
jgi:arylsulfatase A-like enzyme